MQTSARPLSPWETLVLTLQVKARKVSATVLTVLGVVLFGVLCAGFLFRFIALAFDTGWYGADHLIAWTSRLFR